MRLFRDRVVFGGAPHPAPPQYMKRSRRDYPCGCPGGVYTDVLQFFFKSASKRAFTRCFF